MELSGQLYPSAAIVVCTLFFFIAERLFPGRNLPESKGWYIRAVITNLVQLSIVALAGLTWNQWFRSHTLVPIGNWEYPILEGIFYWFVGTFVFYWWHRLRHVKGFWVLFHQIHHSPARIEVLTSFYKHPIEIVSNSMLIGFIMYALFGGTPQAGAWYAFFAALGEYFYHTNIKTPRWFGYFIQRPEHHSIHHKLDVHNYNYGDITWWDRLFGTFKDTSQFAQRCGFPRNNEQRFGEMLLFQDVYSK